MVKRKEPAPVEAAAPGRSYTLISLAVLLAVVCVINLPFAGKAFHLDDTVFVRLAEEKLDDPLSLGLKDHGYEGDLFAEYYDTHPPLLAGYLALLIRVAGSASEIGLHLGFIIFPALAAASMFFLARRFIGSPLVAALLLVVTPGFMVMSQSVMSDVPAVSLWLAAVASYTLAVDRSSNRMLVVSGVAMTLAVMVTYQSLSLVPLLFLYALLKGRVTVRNMVPLAAGLLAFAAFVVYFFIVTGGPPKLSYSIGVINTPAFISKKVLSIISVLGGAIVFPVFLVMGMLKGRKEYLAFAGLAALLLASILIQIAAGTYSLVSALLQVVFYAAGILAFYRFVKAGSDAALARQRSAADFDSIFLAVWIGGVLLYSLALLPYASTRYLLPLFPPVILIFVRYARGVITGARAWRAFAVAAIVVTAASGLAVAVADYQLAAIYRDFAAGPARGLAPEGAQVWVAGEFGLRYYLEADGARYITSQGEQPAAGDYVIISHRLIANFMSDELKGRLQLEQVIDYPSAWPVRIQDQESLAGFYGQFHGYLPYSFSSEPVEEIGIYRAR